MKKFCSLFLSAVATAALLASCGGGGGDSDPQKMTLKDFANGTKMIYVTSGNVTYDINPTGPFNNSERLPEEDQFGVPIYVNGKWFSQKGYTATFVYTALSATEFKIEPSWTVESADRAVEDGVVAAALGVVPDIYEAGEGYRGNLSGLSTVYTFDQAAKTCLVESKWTDTSYERPDPVPMRVPYTIVVK